MSTKTTFKRIALVAVASLGFGVLTSVAPANAGTLTATGLSAGTSTPGRVGVTSYTTITMTHAANTAGSQSDTFVAAAKVTSAPATSVAKTDSNTAGVRVDIMSGSTTSVASGDAHAAGVASATITRTSSATIGATTTSSFDLAFTPDVAGTYTILVSVNTVGTSYAAGDFSVPVTITTVGAPTKIAITKVGGSVVQSGAATAGQLYYFELTDANGNATVLGEGGLEGITVKSSDTTVAIKDAAGNAKAAFSSADNDGTGAYYFRATDNTITAAGTVTITLAGSGLLPASFTTNTTATKVLRTAYTGLTIAVACTTGTTCAGATATPFTAKSAVGITVSGFTSAAAATNFLVQVTAGLDTYDSFMTVAAYATAAAAATATFTVPAPATGYPTTVKINAVDHVFNYAASAATKLTVEGSTTVLSALAGTNKFVAKVVDQYSAAMANVAVSVKVAGRNTVATKALGITDANGLITYSVVDAGTTGTVDTVTFTMATGTTTSAAATINYGTVTVDKVVVSGGSKAETVAGSTLTSIKAGDNGPEGSAVAIKAVVTDANGNLLAGVPVVFTVDSGAIKKTAAVDFATVYTGSDGSASTSVFNWISGKQTITATAGGQSSTDYLTWAANDATTARVLTATATGDIVSLKVVDRFGNAVQGVAINLSRTGAGLFGNGASTQDISTDKNGTADVRFIGSGTVVAELAATYAQAYAAAGNITTKAATAAVAGTTEGTGATLTPAGVAKVSVVIAEGADPVAVSSQAAADAAAEATDAANAATDAANAAAEAADAATAAAQDAADAVAALSTQVSEMVNALKKQITALTNLVIKIQKKVKA
jgi:hypothetical protein